MHNQQLSSLIQQFGVGEADYLFITEMVTTDDLEQLLREQQPQYLEKLSRDGFQVYELDSAFLLWDAELMCLELFKSPDAVAARIRQGRPGDELPVFDAFPVYIDRATFDFEERMDRDTEGLRLALAHHLGISVEQLDFTEASLQVLDQQLRPERINTAFIDRNLIPLSVYIGTTYIRTQGGGWDVDLEPGISRVLPMIKTMQGKRINILRVVYNGLTGKHGAMLGAGGMFRVLG